MIAKLLTTFATLDEEPGESTPPHPDPFMGIRVSVRKQYDAQKCGIAVSNIVKALHRSNTELCGSSIPPLGYMRDLTTKMQIWRTNFQQNSNTI